MNADFKHRRRVRQIALRAQRLVHTALAGNYQSIYKGMGMIFTGVRPYTWGDDVRLMDWKVTARAQEPHIKQYQEERERTIFLLIDASASLFFGTTDRQKREFAAELSSLLVYSALLNQDAVGALFFTDRIESYIPPRKSNQHALHIIHQLLTFQPVNKQTDISQSLQLINRVLPKNSVVFLVSDFLFPIATYEKQLSVTAQRYDLLHFVITDPLEQSFPSVGMMALEDAESQATVWVDTRSEQWQAQFTQTQRNLHTQRTNLFNRLNIPFLELSTGDVQYFQLLVRFFRQLKARRVP